MKKLIWVLLVSLLLTACPEGPLSQKKIDKYKEEGLRYLSEGKYQEAIDNLSLVLEYDDEEFTVTIALAEAYLGLEDYDEALLVLAGVTDKNEKINTMIHHYSGSKYLKGIARVDWETLSDLEVDYIRYFNDKYILFKKDDKYGLLSLTYEVALAPKYSAIFIGIGPFHKKIMVYKSAKHAKNDDYENAYVLDSKLKEKGKAYGFGYEGIDGYFVDAKDKKFKNIKLVADGSGDYVIKVKEVKSLKNDTIVPGAKYDKDFGEYFGNDSWFLVRKDDLSIHKLEGEFSFLEYLLGDGVVKEGMFATEKKGKCAYYNTQGAKVSDFVYDTDGDGLNINCNAYHQGYVVVNQQGKYGLMNESGQLVVELQYEGISGIIDGKFLVLYQGKLGLATLR